MRQPADMVREFMRAFECPIPARLQPLPPVTDDPIDKKRLLQSLILARAGMQAVFTDPVRRLCVDLIFEEFIELVQAELDGDLEGVADALGDLEYVLHYSAIRKGIPLDEVFAEIHRSNMTKLDENGKPIKHPKTGKVVKGPNYEPPNITAILKKEALCLSQSTK